VILLVHTPNAFGQSDLTIVGLLSVSVVGFFNLGNLISAPATEMMVVARGYRLIFVSSCRGFALIMGRLTVTGIGSV